MGFRNTKSAFLDALKNRRVAHETRAAEKDKNWISAGRVTLDLAHEIVAVTRGSEAESLPHHFDPEVEVWIMKPTYQRQRWYIKGYLEGDDLHLLELHLLSFHPSEWRDR